MDAKDVIVIMNTVVNEKHKDLVRALARHNKHHRKMFAALVACAICIYKMERSRKDMQDAIDILAREIKELKATKGE